MAGALSKLGGRVRYELHPEEIREAVVAHLKAKYGLEVKPEMVTGYEGDEIKRYLIATVLVTVEAKP